MDTDGDGVHDPVDLDSDNDGLADLFEDSLGYKDNTTGRIPASVTVDFRGVASLWMRIHRLDWDKDSVPDFRDLDSDNDGIADVVESGYEGSGLYGTVDPPFNADGWIDGSVEEGGNKDGDSLFNHRDHDSDNDGIPDVIEGDGVHLRRLGMIVEGFQDTDSTDGWDDAHYGTKPLNSGDDDQPDFLDRDSDEDSISDFLESRPDALGADKDGNGEIDVLRLNAYGWDSVHGTIDPMNTDLTDLPDYRDRDSDNDSVSDAYEYQFVRDGHSCGHPSVLPIWRDSVLCKVIFYQGFSPNGDRLNDEFVVPGIGYRRNNVFTVFNRWGDVVYKSSPWNGTWDFVGNRGLFANEKPVPDGIYYFTLEFGKNAQHGYFYVRDSKGEDP
jgi:gliding motility-associated-like protein